MLFPEKTITLKNGKTALLRSPKGEEARAVMDYLRICTGETDFLLRYPEECTETDEQERTFLESLNQSPLSLMILAIIDGEIAANCQLNINKRLKVRHRGSVAISILRKYWHQGLGTALFNELITAAKTCGCTQMELEFVEGNTRAQGLYEKMGFTIFAERKDALKLRNGTYLSEFFMVKYL